MAGQPGVSKSRPKRGANKIKRIGSRRRQIEQYYMLRYARNKLRRILDSNGHAAAQSWAAKHLATGVLSDIIQGRNAA